MLTKPEKNADRIKALSAKAAYSHAATRKLAETKSKLAGVNAKIRNAVDTGRIDGSKSLRDAQHAVGRNLETIEMRIEKLRKSSDQSWEGLADDIDSAWEDLSRSVMKLVARFADISE